jgi:hypothetical protein
MAGEPDPQVPEGAAVFPLIPAELGVDPLLLGVLHAIVFLEGSEDEVLEPGAAAEAVEYLATYLQRLEGPQLQKVREDLECLAAYARSQQWPKQQVRFLKTFLDEYGIGQPDGTEDEA